eukprot:Selendium_serpulae@DN6457_c0_g2_i2.p2
MQTLENNDVATLAGGCFWGMQKWFNGKFPGKLSTLVGYIGGQQRDAEYAKVGKGNTNHAEAIQITFDSSVRYEELLEYFWKIHDPTTVNQQGNDKGTQYRSAVFCHTQEQFDTAQRVKAQMQSKWDNKIVTDIVRAEISEFYKAESYHQDYLKNNPGGYCNHKEYHK